MEHIAKKKTGFSKILHVWDVSMPELQHELYIVYYIIEMGQEKDNTVCHLLTLECGNWQIFMVSISYLGHDWLWNMNYNNIQIYQYLTLELILAYLLQDNCTCNCVFDGRKESWEMVLPDRNVAKIFLLSWQYKKSIFYLVTRFKLTFNYLAYWLCSGAGLISGN